MDRLILRMLPAAIRTRHCDELEDMLASSTRPVRDRTDVAIAGVGLRLGRTIRPMLVAAYLAMCGSALGVVHTVANLRHGIAEIREHWGSALSAAAVTASLFASIVLGFATRSAAAWSHPH